MPLNVGTNVAKALLIRQIDSRNMAIVTHIINLATLTFSMNKTKSRIDPRAPH
jgi:hypothetical protein